MSVLRNLESKLESLVEGVFSRAFKAHVQPVEVARKLAKEMEAHKTVSVSRVYVPNEYAVYLSPTDREQFEGYEPALLDELGSYLLEHARKENLALLTRPRVRFETDERLEMGEFGIQARLVRPSEDEREAPSQGDLGATMVYSPAREPRREPPGPAEPPPQRALLVMDGKRFVIDGPRAVLGRSQQCDFVISDPNVSRRHCELQRHGSDWYVLDLDSTNGVQVNGRRVKSRRLSPGDEIVVGTSRLTFDLG